MAYEFKNKNILVTGAAGCIGRGLCANLAKLGAKVFALDKSQEKLDDLVREVPDAIPVCQDLGNWDETKKVVQELGELDGLVNGAVIIFNPQKAVNVPKEHLSESLEINLLGSVNLMQVVGKKMAESGKGGSIVNISSQLGTFAFSGMLAYSLPKAALDMATKMFALELGPDNVRVNTALLGAVSTEVLRRVQTEESIQHLVSRVPLGRLSEVQDVADIVLFLLSERSAMINGSTMVLDGGQGCQLP